MDEYVKNWLIKAKNDIRVAENELYIQTDDIVTEAVCFHSQQAVEKYLKAFLVINNINFGKTHNLEYLLVMCTKLDDEFKNINLGDLTFYAVEVRYPDNFYIPTKQEAKECLDLALKVQTFVLRKLE